MWKQDLCYNYKSLPTCHTCTMPCGPGSETWVGHTLRMFQFSNENITVDFLQLFFIPGSCDTPKLNKGEQMLSPRIFRKITPEEKRKACFVVALTCIYTIVNWELSSFFITEQKKPPKCYFEMFVTVTHTSSWSNKCIE